MEQLHNANGATTGREDLPPEEHADTTLKLSLDECGDECGDWLCFHAPSRPLISLITFAYLFHISTPSFRWAVASG